ncbi:helix-turn-helix transcriptional regulator [Cohnella thailandensis]|uniref:YafY family transcriptional regulator n=1 Tax=Cohnella thailandensis TaxID=557557 RepID=A0A841SU10_9BACL|nr:YafY family protein [Cohnella thailandensis]MBB6633117.1 YafY family transcriptional regulator [Cohnella thailandensis]MBP1975188.1 putative DNA-binding transcriptional regulator YafY [Cohnella thailandensis]
MKLERLISMIYMLLNNEVVSASALAEKYGVSQRTIYRDIDAICAAGIPVVSYQGVNGGYGIIESYKMDRSLLGTYDVGSLITVLHSMSTVFDDERAMETVRKLQTIQKDDRPPNLSMDMGSLRSYNESLRMLRSAISDRHAVEFEYVSGKNERTRRAVEPVSLHYQYDTWFLFGYCRSRNDYREFRLSRMAELRLLPDRFERRHDASPQRMTFEKFRWNDHIDVVLRFSSESMAKALDYFYDAERSFNPDGSLTIRLKLDNAVGEKRLLSIILSFGSEAEIIEPLELRQTLKDTIQKISRIYSQV